MAASTRTSTWLDEAFLTAKEEFLEGLTNKARTEFSKLDITTIEDVYDAAKKIEQQQAKTKSFRGLKRIEPLIRLFKEYGETVETFVQAKPDILSLIWGPLKLLLQAASVLTAAFQKVVKILGDVGQILPSFKQYATLFPQNDHIRRGLCLFFEDILGLYSVLLNLVTDRRLKVILEPLWPNTRAKIDTIQENIENHKSLMTVNVTLEDISRAQRARKQALEEFERAQTFRDHQTFSTIRNEIRPETHHVKLADILQHTSTGSGEWLSQERNFMKWLDPSDRTARCLWLCGIPGAGKTYLAANIIQRMQKTGQCVLFAFISYETQALGMTLNVLHSLLFQALDEVPSLRPLLPNLSDSEHTKLAKDRGFVKNLLCSVLTSIGSTFIVIDGIDETEEGALKDLLLTILDVESNCAETKLLLSSREVRQITLAIPKHAITLRVDRNNIGDIEAFVKSESRDLLVEIENYGAGREVLSRIQGALDTVATKAGGMFLYAKLVLHVIKDYRSPSEIESEVENLPDGLDQAYGRVMSRIEVKMKLRAVVHRILMWITCAKRPLREEELLQILAVDIGEADFTRGRKDYRDICQACGPIIEVIDGVVRFVHFSAKEYLLHDQSNNFLRLKDAHLDASLTCATYLCYSSLDTLFDVDKEPADVKRQIVDGDFVFLEYAVLQFLEHIKAWVSHRGPQDSALRISEIVGNLVETRRNGAFKGAKPHESYISQFEVLQEHPHLQQSLASAAYFMTGACAGMLMVDDTTGSSADDPLTFFLAVTALRQHLEDIICDGPNHDDLCSCQKVKSLYGSQLYFCNKIFCSAYGLGFHTKEFRDQHLATHSLRFKCPESDCIFTEGGLRSKNELSRHLASAHTKLEIPVASKTNGSPAALTLGDRSLILQDAVLNSRLDTVKELMTSEVLGWECQNTERLIETAAWFSSSELLLWLLEQPWSSFPISINDDALAAAIEGENLPNIKLLLSRGADIMKKTSLHPQDWCQRERVWLQCGYIRALRLWHPELMRFLVEECGVTIASTSTLGSSHPARVFEAWHLSESTVSTADLKDRFAAIKPYMPWPEAYLLGPEFAVNTRLPWVVKLSLDHGGDPNRATGHWKPLYHAVLMGQAEIVKLLLQHGGNPNDAHGKRNLLHCAVQKGRAEIVKLLLQHGAVPKMTRSNGSKDLEHLNGMKKIERYFGASWKEIVERVQAGEDIEGGRNG